MNAQRHLRIATIASLFLFLVIAGFAMFAGTTTSIAARGNTGKALAFQAVLASNKKKLFNTSSFVPGGRQRNTSDGRFILDRSFLQARDIAPVAPVQGPVQTFDTLAPPNSFTPFSTTLPDGTTVTEPRVATNVTPVWSRDESYILYSSNRTASGAVAADGRFHIWAISSNGGQALQVTTSAPLAGDTPGQAHGEFYPALNPANTQLAFTSDARSSNVQTLYVLNNFQPGQPVTDVATLTTSANSKTLRSDNLPLDFDDVRRPTWGGGGQIAFSARTTSGPYTGHYHIYFLYATSLGFNATPSASNPPAKLTNGPADDNNPAWAADGGYIAFDSTTAGLDANGGISGSFSSSPILTRVPADGSGIHSIFLITSAGNIPASLAGSNGRLTIAGTDDVTPAWSFGTTNPYSNPRGDTEYLAFARGAAPAATHDIFFLKTVAKQIAPGGESAPSNLAIAQYVAPGTAIYQLDAGSNVAVPPYAADDQTVITWTGGSVGTFPAGATVNTAGVQNAAPAAVYTTFHTATNASRNFTYNIPGLAPNANYTLRLHFAEPTATASGQRVFNISVNGAPIATNYDIFAQAGAQNVATVINQNPVTADATGAIAVTFTSVTGNAIVNGIEVIAQNAGRSVTSGTSPDTAPKNVLAVPQIGPRTGAPAIVVTWNAPTIGNPVSYNVYRSSSLPGGQTPILLAAGILATDNVQGLYTYEDDNIVQGVTYTYFVTAVTASSSSTAVFAENGQTAHRINTETLGNGRASFHNLYPAWSPFIRVLSIVYQSDRSITYTDPTTNQPSEIEVSLPQGNVSPPIGPNYFGILQSQVVNVDPPTLQKFNNNEIVHVNVGSAPIMPSAADETGSATHQVLQTQNPSEQAQFTVRLSDRTAGIDNTGGPNSGPNVYIQIKNPNSKYQDDQGLEHKVFAQDPSTFFDPTTGTFGPTKDPTSGTANHRLYNGFGLGDRPVPYDDQHGQQIDNGRAYYQKGVIAGLDGAVPLAIGVNLGDFLWYPPGADLTKRPLRGGDPNNFKSYGPEYECQYVNPTVLTPFQALGDYGTPFYLAGYDDRTPFSEDNPLGGVPRPSTEWLQLHVAPDAMQDHKGGVLYTAAWNVPTNTRSDYYIDVIAYNQAVYPFDGSVDVHNYTRGDWRIYDNVWGVSSQDADSSNDLLVVSDNMLGQKFVATSFGGDNSFLSNLLPVFYGAESYVTGVDNALLPNAGYYYVKDAVFEPYVEPIWALVPFGANGYSVFPNITPIRNGLGVNSYIDPIIDDGALTSDGYSNFKSQRYSIWRTLCRGPLNASFLAGYGPSVTPSQPAVKDTTLGIDIPAAAVPTATRAVLWFSPFAGDLFTGPGTYTDTATQTMLTNFVNGGGRLLVSGQDVVSSSANSDFVKNTLHVTQNGGGGYQVAPGAGNAIGEPNGTISNDFRYDPKWRTDSSLDQLGPTATDFYAGFDGTVQRLVGQIDGITPTGGALSDLVFAGGGVSGLTHYENPDPANGSRVVVASFGLEGLSQEVVKVVDGPTGPRNFHLETQNLRSVTIHNIVSYLRTGSFTGTITKSDFPASSTQGALVYAVPVNGPLGVRKAYSATVNSQNSYTILGVPPGTYKIYVSLPGYQVTPSAATPVEGDVNVDVGLIVQPLAPASITGIVEDFFSKQPVGGATVTLTAPGVTPIVVSTGPDGVYTASPLLAYATGLTYTIVASKDPIYAASTPVSITVFPGDKIDGTRANPSANDLLANIFVKPVPGTVAGRVFDTSTNAGIVGATVTISLNGAVAQTTTSGVGGAYTVDLGAGTYTVTATKTGYDTKTITVTVVAQQTTSGQDIGLTPIPPGYVGGMVVNTATGQPVSGVTVTILASDLKTQVAQFTTGAASPSPAAPQGDGGLVNYLGSLPEGTYGIQVVDPALGTALPLDPAIAASGTFTITRGKFTRVDLRFNLGTLGGLVTGGPNSPPLAGVTVTVTNGAGAVVATATTGAVSSPSAPAADSGPLNYRLFLAAGTYGVTFSKTGYTTSAVQSATIIVGGFTRLDYAFAVVTSFPAGLQMISAPYDYSAFSLDTLFGADRSKLVIWQPQLLQYVVDPTPPADNLHLGYGYWIKLPHAVDIAFKGTPPSGGTVAVPLHRFWNQIGCPNNRAINLAELRFLNPLTPTTTLTFADASSIRYNLVSPTVYGYDQASNKYVPVTSLSPWHGYWIKVYDDTTVYMPTTP